MARCTSSHTAEACIGSFHRSSGFSVVLAIAGCSGLLDDGGPPPPPPPGTPTLAILDTFVAPLYLTAPRADSSRLFIVEREGRVVIVRNDTTLARPFFDIRGKINAGGEEGLLSLAFHPDYANNGRFYVYFTDSLGDLRVVRYSVSSDPDSADPASADTVLKIAHPGESNHNGGQLQFGPDSMLWVGTGDGGGGGDPDDNGQNKHALLGKLLRLDVSGASGYAIPADNPFANDTSGAPEVWSYGLRNPWRFSFDRLTGTLYIADVGQGAWEEVNVATVAGELGRGANYGWNIMEGMHCYPSGPCVNPGVLPFVEYPHLGGACSITGGYVYRGAALPAINGRYFFADFCTGAVTAFAFPSPTTGDWSQQLRPGGNISSFGEDARGELYIVQLSGPVYRIIPTPAP